MRPPPPRRAGARRAPRPLLALRREPRRWWACMAGLAAAAGWAAAAVVGHAEDLRAAWGASVLVVVAAHDLEPGEAVSPADVDVVARPRAMVPATALRRLPSGARARDHVAAGEILVSTRLVSGLGPIAARLHDGTRAVSIPVEPGTAPPLAVGDRVAVLVALADTEGGEPPGFALVEGATVVSVDDGAVTVAVPRDAAPRVAVALARGAVTLALAGADAQRAT